MTPQLRIGTRGSPLALAQARWVQAELETQHPHLTVSLTIIKTTGDKILDVPLAQVGGKGLFTKEIEQALLAGGVDLGVHSMKDVPAELPEGLMISTITAREDWRDALISHRYQRLDDIPAGGRIGTSSLRRRAQLLHHRPDLQILPLRGNVETRLRKLAEENLDAIILAVAGLNRLGLKHLITCYLPPEQMLPAIGQGALGLELRGPDTQTLNLVACLDDPASRVAVRARALGMDVLAHNLETVERLYPRVRPGADYLRSLEILRWAMVEHPSIPTKSGLMLGLGESKPEVEKIFHDLLNAGCQVLTLGQYLQPSTGQVPVERYVPPEEFDKWRDKALDMGFRAVASGPFVRSSYRAEALCAKARGAGRITADRSWETGR